MSLISHLELVYQAAMRAVCPYKLVRDALNFVPAAGGTREEVKPTAGILECDGNKFEIDTNVKSMG